MSLEAQFEQEMLEGSRTLQKEYRYNPTYFLQMVREHGGVGAVRRLLKAENYQDGLTKLWELGRLDMSIEAAVLEPRWASLFTDDEKRIAKKRLAVLGYPPPKEKSS